MKNTYFLLGLIGGTLVLASIYFQLSSMDLGRYPLGQYIVVDTALPAWWDVVAFPFIVGTSFLITAIRCFRVVPNRKATLLVLGVCFALAALLFVVNAPLGAYAAAPLLFLLIGNVRHAP